MGRKRKVIQLNSTEPTPDYSPQQQKQLSQGYHGFRLKSTSITPPIIQRIDASTISSELFYNTFIKTRTPIILTNLHHDNDFSSLKGWSNSYLKSIAGNSILQIEQRTTTKTHFGKDAPRHPMSFQSFLEKLATGNELYYLTSQTSNYEGNELPDLLAEPLVSLQKEFPIRPKIMSNLIPYQINLWMGNTKNGSSSGLHHDYHDNLYFLQRGCKVFNIFPPSDAPFLSPYGKLQTIHPNGLIVYHSSPTINQNCIPALDFFHFCHTFLAHLQMWSKIVQFLTLYHQKNKNLQEKNNSKLKPTTKEQPIQFTNPQIDLILTHTPFNTIHSITALNSNHTKLDYEKYLLSINDAITQGLFSLPLLYSNLSNRLDLNSNSHDNNDLTISLHTIPTSILGIISARIATWQNYLMKQLEYLIFKYKFTNADKTMMAKNDTLFGTTSVAENVAKSTSNTDNNSDTDDNDIFEGGWGQADSDMDDEAPFFNQDHDDFDDMNLGISDNDGDSSLIPVKLIKESKRAHKSKNLMSSNKINTGIDIDDYESIFANICDSDDDYETLLNKKGTNKKGATQKKSTLDTNGDDEIFPHFTKVSQSILYQHYPRNPPSFDEIAKQSSLQLPPSSLYSLLHSQILSSQSAGMNGETASSIQENENSTLFSIKNEVRKSIIGKNKQEQIVIDQLVQSQKATVVLMPGEALYLPASWFHEVRSYNIPPQTSAHIDKNDCKTLESHHKSFSEDLLTQIRDTQEWGGHMALNYWFFPPSVDLQTYSVDYNIDSNVTPSFTQPYGDNLFWQFWWAKSYGKRYKLAFQLDDTISSLLFHK